MITHGPAGTNKADKFSIAMRFLIHYVGDAHQPLHGTTRVDADHKQGDKGGNDFPTKGHYGASELHAVWDAVVYEYHTNPKLPFSESDWDLFGTYAKKLTGDHPISSLPDVTNLDPNDWEKESFEIASTFVYKGIVEGKTDPLPAAYVTEGQLIAEKRIVTAGHRLANLLKSLKLPSHALVQESENFLS